MEISYFGLAAFRLKGAGVSVITDPYSKEVGLKLPKLSGEMVTVSHEHFDHNNVGVVAGTARRGKPLIIRAPGEYEAEGVSVYGFPSFHDNKEGVERGKNTMYLIYMDGIRVLHMGDLGHTLSDKKVEAIGEVDVMLVPVGGVYTIGVKEAVKVIQAIQPAIVIPMHYRLAGLAKSFSDLAGEEEFVREVGEVKREEKLEISRAELPEATEYVVLATKTS